MGRPRSETAKAKGSQAQASRRPRLSDKGQAKRDLILDAAEELFSEQGFVPTPVRDIANLAGADLGSITYHFASKDELFTEVIARRAEAACAAVDVALTKAKAKFGSTLSVEIILDAYAKAVFRPLVKGDVGWTHYCRLVFQTISLERAGQAHAIDAFYHPVRKKYLDTISELLPGMPKEDIKWCFGMFEAAFGSMLFGSQNETHKKPIGSRAELKLLQAYLAPYSAAGFHRIAERHYISKAERDPTPPLTTLKAINQQNHPPRLKQE
jgi:AcrR family transcriptional regulator